MSKLRFSSKKSPSARAHARRMRKPLVHQQQSPQQQHTLRIQAFERDQSLMSVAAAKLAAMLGGQLIRRRTTANLRRKVSASSETTTLLVELQEGRCEGLVQYRNDVPEYMSCENPVSLEVGENDHILELQNGGEDTLGNLQRLCFSCHRGPGGKTAANRLAYKRNEAQAVW